MNLDTCFQNVERPAMHFDRPIKGLSIQAADIAVRIMKTHQPMNRRNRPERGIDRPMDPRFDRPRGLNLHKSSEQWFCAANPI